ncbi:MAG: YdcF family protein [Hyphomicrobiales bacterium]|nr:YdcF family protein [Hyphomicrobiales bacterium]
MFFPLSKIFWFVALPSNLLVLLVAAGVTLLFTRWRRAGRALCTAAVLGFLVAGFLPLGVVLLGPLENRFTRPAADAPAPDVILVLGGALDTDLSLVRGIVSLTDAGGRMTEAVALARRYPEARIVFSGGSARLVGAGTPETAAAQRYFQQMGIDPARISYESRSRNTYENAVFTRDLFQPKSDERWWLVTSAFHMPRSMGIFRQAGFPVTPWPAHYYTAPGKFRWMEVSYGLRLTEVGVREWVGLAAYWLSGRTDSLFPAASSGGKPSL